MNTMAQMSQLSLDEIQLLAAAAAAANPANPNAAAAAVAAAAAASSSRQQQHRHHSQSSTSSSAAMAAAAAAAVAAAAAAAASSPANSSSNKVSTAGSVARTPTPTQNGTLSLQFESPLPAGGGLGGPLIEGQGQSKYQQLLSVIEEMSKDIRPTYAGSKSSAERLKRGIVYARILVRECLVETERSART